MSESAIRTALAELVAAASNYVKPRRAVESRQLLLEALDAARSALAEQPDRDEELAAMAEDVLRQEREDHSARSSLAEQPSERVPLMRGQIVELWGPRSDGPSNAELISFARAIEAAHGIGTKEEA